MRFSVLMSVYFKEKSEFLKSSLNSVLNQTLKPSEIVLIKDGELTDELNEVINQFVNNNPKLFKIISFKKNKGLGIALNEGVKACNYNIIARMDTDDIAKPFRFEKQIKFLTNNPEIDLVGSSVDEFEDNIDNVVAKKCVPKKHNQILKYAKKRNPFNHPTVMYRKNSVLTSGNYSDFLWNEDYLLWVNMIINEMKMHNIQESLLYFRSSSEMYKRRGGYRYALQEIKLQKKFLDLKFINYTEFIVNIFIRVGMRIIPNFLRKMIYNKLLRK